MFFLTSLLFAAKKDDLNLSAMIQPADSSLFVRDANYFNWCNSVIKGEDGKYHLFYARWPKSIGFYAWLTHSEIAHAVADHPYGPYKNGKTLMQASPEGLDKITMHNVQVRKFNDRYYMYYTTTNSGEVSLSNSDLVEIAKTGYSHPYWNLLRSNQRARVAVSSTLDGPWQKFNHNIVEPNGPIYTVAVNPSVCHKENGRYYLIIKGDDNPSPRHHLIQAIATSSTPEGPFILEEKPAFSEIPTEDVCVWYDNARQRFYAIFHAQSRNYIGMITSEDGINWHKAKHYVVCKKEIPLNDGTVMKVSRMERPCLYLENGVPKTLSFGARKGNDAFIVFFKLENK